MSEFFLEFFSEEIPVNLQKNAREALLQNFKDFFEKENIVFSGKSLSFSTPNRLLILFDRLNKEVIQKAEEIRGPSINAPEKALEGFLRSHNIMKEEIFKKNTDKGEFYFYKKLEKKIKTVDLLKENIPQVLEKISWKKSMKWADFNLKWGRPLKSILAIFDMLEQESKSLLEKNLSLPAYDQCLKASHVFNILDARGVISVAQRAEYISRIREITKGAGEIWLKSQTK